MGSIKFVNASAFDASVYTLDDGGNATLVVDLAPNTSSDQNTTAGQAWVAKDKDTGREVGKVTGTSGHQTYRIEFKRARGEPQSSGAGG
jgi:hypothetical protein